jgi:pyruvate/2-oxoglutarate dehydrogenase complex dihydrolipoamide dehydrogenase (E3) component
MHQRLAPNWQLAIGNWQCHALSVSTGREYDYDLVIIGGGSGGYAAARTAAGAGLKTVVVEGGEEVGGLCILRGCMPTKALLYAAEVMHLASHAEPWGIRAEEVSFNFAKVMARKNALIKEFATDRQRQLLGGKFEFRRANARFRDTHTVDLAPALGAPASLPTSPAETGRAGRDAGAPGGQHTLTAEHFLLATGSTIAPSPLPQLDEVGCLNSDTALKLEKLPRSLIVLGGGLVAVEFAQFFARFGVKVTLIQRSAHVLHHLDADATSELEKVFRREGIVLYTGTKLLDARRAGPHKEVAFEHNGQAVRARAEEIFFGLGRVPNTASLGLEAIGVQMEDGRIVTNARMETSVPHVYAAGDCTGPYEIVHLAVQQGEIAAHNIAHPEHPREMDYRLLAEVIFTEPQIAVVGLTEKEAKARNIRYLAASYPFSDHGKSLIMEVRDGFVKLLADPESGEILGGCCVGPLGGELIHEILVAMQKRMTVQELAVTPHYHPTLAEIWTYPAEEVAGKVRPPTPAKPASRMAQSS